MVDIRILFEDEHTLVINKPSGLLVHPDGTSTEETLIDWVLSTRPEMKGVGEIARLKDGTEIERPGIVHRLDRETSGALLLAKTSSAHAHYKHLFQLRTIKKRYILFVHGHFKEREGVINRPIGKSRSDFRKWSAERGARGLLRSAVTEYQVLSEKDDISLVEARPLTGRTHQIRVHFKAINHPIVCDQLYAPKRADVLGFDRLALHSYGLSFETPEGLQKEIRAPFPDDFQSALAVFSIDERAFV